MFKGTPFPRRGPEGACQEPCDKASMFGQRSSALIRSLALVFRLGPKLDVRRVVLACKLFLRSATHSLHGRSGVIE